MARQDAVALVWFLFTAVAGAAPPSAEQLRGWVRQLDADSFAVREEAGRQLAAAGESAIEALSEGIGSSSPEAAWRASTVLEQIALRGSDAALDRVVAALQRLSQQGKPGLVAVANELHAKQAKLRRDRAVAKIRSLGGKLAGGQPELAAIDGGLMFGAIGPGLLIVEEEEGKLGLDLAKVKEEGKAVEPPPPAAAAGIDAALKAVDVLLSGLPVEPSPPPDAPPPEAAPADAAFAAPAIGEAFGGDFVEVIFPAEAALPAALPDEAAESVTIDRAWRGGDGGLAALRDLPGLVSLSLHHAPLTDAALDHIAVLPKLRSLDIERTAFTTAALFKFRQRQPDVRIFARGTAMLGVSAEMSGLCVVTGVQPGSGAAAAGLQAGDKIVAVAGESVSDFSDLTIAIAARQPGEKLRVEFHRGGEPQSAEVLLMERKP